MKSIFLIFIVLLVSCQRETKNELGLGYNKQLIIPPTNDLPQPNSSDENLSNYEISNNPLIESILNQTQANEANPSIIDESDSGNELETDESEIEPKGSFFQRLFKGKKSKS